MSRNPLTSAEEAHLQTGTLDTSGYGQGDLRDVALIYRSPREGAAAPADDSDPESLTPPPLFDADGEPTPEALPHSHDGPQEPGEDPETPQTVPEADSPQEPAQDDTGAEDAGAPVEPTASADKGSKAAPTAKGTNRRRAG